RRRERRRHHALTLTADRPQLRRRHFPCLRRNTGSLFRAHMVDFSTPIICRQSEKRRAHGNALTERHCFFVLIDPRSACRPRSRSSSL
ncbi:MAG: hypothetical protein ACLQJR_04125, partial [Stellaceae bacterium]